jgi:hypothetical protein
VSIPHPRESGFLNGAPGIECSLDQESVHLPASRGEHGLASSWVQAIEEVRDLWHLGGRKRRLRLGPLERPMDRGQVRGLMSSGAIVIELQELGDQRARALRAAGEVGLPEAELLHPVERTPSPRIIYRIG